MSDLILGVAFLLLLLAALLVLRSLLLLPVPARHLFSAITGGRQRLSRVLLLFASGGISITSVATGVLDPAAAETPQGGLLPVLLAGSSLYYLWDKRSTK